VRKKPAEAGGGKTCLVQNAKCVITCSAIYLAAIKPQKNVAMKQALMKKNLDASGIGPSNFFLLRKAMQNSCLRHIKSLCVKSGMPVLF